MSLKKIGLTITFLACLFFAGFFTQAYNADKGLTERTLLRHYALQRAINDFYCQAPRATVSCDDILRQIDRLTTRLAEEKSPLEKARLSVNRQRLYDQLTPLSDHVHIVLSESDPLNAMPLPELLGLQLTVSKQLAAHGLTPPSAHFEALMIDKLHLTEHAN